MKNFLVIIFCFALIFASSLTKGFDVLNNYNVLSVQVFADTKSNLQCEHIDNGVGEVYFCDIENYQKIANKINCSGITFVLEGGEVTFNKIYKQLKIVCAKKDKTSFIGYTNCFDKSVMLNNKKINVQGYFDGNQVFIGTPLILGCY